MNEELSGVVVARLLLPVWSNGARLNAEEVKAAADEAYRGLGLVTVRSWPATLGVPGFVLAEVTAVVLYASAVEAVAAVRAAASRLVSLLPADAWSVETEDGLKLAPSERYVEPLRVGEEVDG